MVRHVIAPSPVGADAPATSPGWGATLGGTSVTLATVVPAADDARALIFASANTRAVDVGVAWRDRLRRCRASTRPLGNHCHAGIARGCRCSRIASTFEPMSSLTSPGLGAHALTLRSFNLTRSSSSSKFTREGTSKWIRAQRDEQNSSPSVTVSAFSVLRQPLLAQG